MDFKQALRSARLLPIITLRSKQQIQNVKKVLEASTIEMVEVAFRSDLAIEAIQEFSNIENVLIGAGTVRNLAQAKAAVEHGAKFLVSPGYDSEVVNFANDHKIPITPGVLTPTEILKGINEGGLSVFKIFPANLIGGLTGIQALKGPFFDVEFLPTGGVNSENFELFLADSHIISVGGSFIIDEAVEETDIEKDVIRINELIRRAKAVKK